MQNTMTLATFLPAGPGIAGSAELYCHKAISDLLERHLDTLRAQNTNCAELLPH